ncbi:MAG: PorV/PorQ family protein [Gemmatimonadota bacterium]
MIRRAWIGLLGSLVMYSPVELAAQLAPPPSDINWSNHQSEPSSSSSEGALFLLLPVGAQGVAMGRAMTAMGSVEGAFWNPASLASVSSRAFVIYRGDHLAGEATALSLVSPRGRFGTFGLSYQLLDVGDQLLTDGTGEVQGSLSIRNHLAVLSYALRLAPRLDVGTNVKLVQFRVSCRGLCLDAGITATSWAVDVGTRIMPFPDLPIRIGAMVAHLGPRLQVVNAEQADPLPTRLRLSAAADVLALVRPHPDFSLWITAEVEDRARDLGEPALYTGVEFSAGGDDQVFVRGGYVLGQVEQTDGPALGMGARFDRFQLGIAKSLARMSLTGETEPVHITLGIYF